MLSLSPAKLLIVAIVALVLVGPDKLPQVARQLGALWKALRNFSQKIETEVRASVPELPSSEDIVKYARSPLSLLDSLAKWDDSSLCEDPTETPSSGLTDHLKNDPSGPSDQSSAEPLREYVGDESFDPRWN